MRATLWPTIAGSDLEGASLRYWYVDEAVMTLTCPI